MRRGRVIAVLAVSVLALASCAKKNRAGQDAEPGASIVKIGIARANQHVAMEEVEQGIVDALAANEIPVLIDFQNASGDAEKAREIALKFQDEEVDVAVGIGTSIAVELARAIKTVPVVFATVTDPVEAGLVKTTAHGEGNVTGSSDFIDTVEQIRLFKETAGIKTLGYICTESEANSASSLELVEAGCAKAGIVLIVEKISSARDVEQAARSLAPRVDGIYLTTDNTVFSEIERLVRVFSEARKPIFSADATSAKSGGILLASGFNYYKAGRATGDMIARILSGEKPDEMPVRFMTKSRDKDFLIDLDAAKNCGITISKSLLEQANMIYENGILTEIMSQ